MASSSGQWSDSSGASKKRRDPGVPRAEGPRRTSEAGPQAARSVRTRHPGPDGPTEGGRTRSTHGPRGRGRSAPTGEAYAKRKRAEREERRAGSSAHARRRTVALLVLAVLVVAGVLALYRSSALRVSSIQVTGVHELTASSVVRLAAVPKDATLLRVSTKAIGRRVARSAWVSSVHVRRALPHTLIIEVTERRPFALLDMGDTFWLVDSGGVALARESLDATSSLVVVRDVTGLEPKAGTRLASKTLVNALNVLRGLSASLRSQIRVVSAPSIDETSQITKSGIEILNGSADERATKDALARRILREQKGKVVFVDVRTTSRPVWRGLGN
jgi:cell division protein FtsQ